MILLRYKRYGLLIVIAFWLFGCSGQTECSIVKEKNVEQNIDENTEIDTHHFETMYKRVYGTSIDEEEKKNLEMTREFINRLGEEGYTAVDAENQINMVNADQAERFCDRVKNGTADELTIITVLQDGGMVEYDFHTSEGKVNVIEQYYSYENDALKCTGTNEYPAYTWEYTEEGYLFFEQYHMPGYDGPSGHTALRVKSLDEKCRELNRKYIQPVGYGKNNLFLVNWNEKDFGDVDFYDLFDIFYPEVYEKSSPYCADENSGEGMIYQIPEQEFETVLLSYFNIETKILREKTKYLQDEYIYEYRPRGLYDCEAPDIPYPEVVDYNENEDGTITLIVNAVYPDKNTSKVFCHQVVVRPVNDSRFQYVSNQVILSENGEIGSWHVDRLTEEEWKKYYDADE